jgi:hypothetical protein
VVIAGRFESLILLALSEQFVKFSMRPRAPVRGRGAGTLKIEGRLAIVDRHTTKKRPRPHRSCSGGGGMRPATCIVAAKTVASDR